MTESQYTGNRMLIDLSILEVKEIVKWRFFSLAKSKITNFQINEANKETLNALFAYFHGNTGIFDLKKGIYMFGEFGCGKTSIFSLFSKYLSIYFPFSDYGFGNASIEEISEFYKKNNSTEKYVFSEYSGKPYRICLHEIGKEIDEKYYGTSINQVINSLMMRRYEIFQKFGTVTHITSNFNPKQLKCFDDATIDRLKEMFNFVEWHGESFR